jgi:ribonuclease HI
VTLNTDGAFDVKYGLGSVAAVVRDHHGQVISARARWIGCVGDAMMTEALAARFGMEVAQELRCENVVLEVDNSTLAYALKMPRADRSMIAGICQDIRELCSGFPSLC